MSQTRINWRAIKHAYLYDSPQPTMAELAEQYDCHVSALQKRSADEKWNELRKDAQARAEAKLYLKTEEQIAETYAKWDERHLKGAETIYYTAISELREALQAKSNAPDTIMSSTDIQKYAAMLKLAMEIERTVHGRDKLKIEHSGSVATDLGDDERTRLIDAIKGYDEARA